MLTMELRYHILAMIIAALLARQIWGPGVVAMGFGYPRQIRLPAEYVLGLQVEDEPEPLYFVHKPLYDSVEIGDVIQVTISHWYDKRGICWKTEIEDAAKERMISV